MGHSDVIFRMSSILKWVGFWQLVMWVGRRLELKEGFILSKPYDRQVLQKGRNGNVDPSSHFPLPKSASGAVRNVASAVVLEPPHLRVSIYLFIL